MSKTPTTDAAEMSRKACIQYLQTHGIYSGHSRDSIEQLRAVVAEHATPVAKPTPASSTPKVAKAAADLTAIGADPALAEQLADLRTDTSTLATDRVERKNRANREAAALQAWQEAGAKGDPPATPNLDAITSGTPVPKPGSAKGPASVRRSGNPRRAQANECRKAHGGKARPNPRKVDADELNAYITKVRAEHPESSREDELEVAYWCEQIAVSRGRWNSAWELLSV